MMESRTIIEFRIVYSNQKTKKRRPISEFLYIESLLAFQGISHIRMIVFYMNDGYHYPYGIHPITLKQYDNKLYVFFYHYYNIYNQVIGLSIEQQMLDYRCIIQLLDHPTGVLLPLLQPPCVIV
jgi:hypothetical protein